MTFTIFYAWQSDRSGGVCRHLIRKALENAAAALAEEVKASVEDAPRPDLSVVSDTGGVSGTPPVAETILRRISECDAFVADLTPVASRPNGGMAPNPNVLVEYGYALRAVGDERVVSIMNTEFGHPRELPFDLRHRRWPVPYALAEGVNDKERQTASEQLVRHLKLALREVVKHGPRDVAEVRPDRRDLWGENSTVYRPDHGFVPIPLRPSLTVELAPTSPKPELTHSKMKVVAGHLVPPESADGNYVGRFSDGVVRFTADWQSDAIRSASAVTEDSRLHAVDFVTLEESQPADRYVPTKAVERCCRRRSATCLTWQNGN